jgi:prepilin-type processing-associated H-X9-DG protein
MIYSSGAADAERTPGADPVAEVKKALAQLPPEQMKMVDEWIDWDKLPTSGSFDKYLGDQLDVAHADDDGLLFVGYGMLGGSGMPMLTAAGGISAGLLLPALATAREKARRTKCMSNLKQIGVAIHVYSTDNRDRFPKSFTELVPRYLLDRALLECPSDPGDVAYGYVSGLTAAGRPTWVMAFDLDDNHDGDGRNVLYLDGHVEWQRETRFQSELKRTLDEARARDIKLEVLRGDEAFDADAAGEGEKDGDLF